MKFQERGRFRHLFTYLELEFETGSKSKSSPLSVITAVLGIGALALFWAILV